MFWCLTGIRVLIPGLSAGISAPALDDRLRFRAAPPRAYDLSCRPPRLAEPDFYNSALAQQLTSQFNEQVTLATGPILPLDNYPGDATGIAFLGHGVALAAAEPVRLYGGSALVVHPGP